MKKIFSFLSLFLLFSQIFAQVQLFPKPNPTVMRWHESTFSVNVVNLYGAVTGLTLEITATPGFQLQPQTPFASIPYTGIDIGAGASESFLFTVIPDCNAPQNGGRIYYTLKNSGGTVLHTEQSHEITIREADILFVAPPDHVADYSSATKIYERVWAITPSAPEADITHVYVTNSVNTTTANFEIIKAEWVSDITGTTSYGDLAGYFTFAGNVYTYAFDNTTFNHYGFTDGKFHKGDTVFIKETYRIKTCTPTQSVYRVSYGNDAVWCPDPITHEKPEIVKTSVLEMTYTFNHDNATILNQVTGTGAGIGVGRYMYQFLNMNSNPKAIFRDAGINISTMTSYLTATRVYFSDASGNPLPDLLDLVLSPSPSYPTDPRYKIISFNDFTNPAYAAVGLIDADGDEIWNDIPPLTTSIRIVVEFEYDLNKVVSCAPIVIDDRFTRNLFFSLNCNNGNSHSSYDPQGGLGYNAPQNSKVYPENVIPGAKTILSFCQSEAPVFQNRGWPLSVSAYDHYVLITLPEGFDYDLTKEGFRINGTVIPIGDVSKATVGGRVVLTVHNKIVNHSASMCFSIDMFFDPAYAIPCEDNFDKKFRIEHEFAFKGESQHFKYACYDTPLNYLIVDPTKSLEMSFDAQRMTFGWDNSSEDWTGFDRITRITLDNIHLYPGVNRSVAGPYDNVDFTTTMTLKSNTTYNGASIDNTFEWFVQIGYDAPITSPLGGCFMFPDSDKAVKVEITGKDEFWLPSSTIDSVRTGNRYTFLLNIAPYTLGNSNYEIGDEVKVTFKMRTTENMPNVLTPVSNVTTTTWLDPPLDACGVLTSMKNFSVVDYAIRSLGTVGSNTFYENRHSNNRLNGTTPNNMSSNIIFPYEYRPNQYLSYYEVVFNTLWNIRSVSIRQYQIFNSSHIVNPINKDKVLTPNEYTVTHDGGKTIFATTKEFELADTRGHTFNARALFNYFIDGIPYCPINSTASAKAKYLFYPSSERTDVTGEYSTVSNYNYYNASYYYTTALEASTAQADILSNAASWNFSLKNNSIWANLPLPSGVSSQDNVLPYSWLSVTVPPHIVPSSITDGVNTWTEFINYGSGKYWVQLGSLTVPGATPKNFTLTCNTNNYEPFKAELKFGQSRWRYPTNPDVGFLGADAPCPNSSTLTLFAFPVPGMVRGTIASPPYDHGLGYSFCVPHDYRTTFFNTYNTSVLTDPVLKLTLCQGLELVTFADPGPPEYFEPYAIHNGLPIDIFIDDPDPTAGTWREVTITFPPGTTLEKYGMPGDTIAVYFQLKPVCEFTNKHVVYATYSATAPSGNSVGEKQGAIPLNIEGIFLFSNYDIPPFTVTTHPSTIMDLRNTTAANAAEVTIDAKVKMISAIQTTDLAYNIVDYVAISIPPNMQIVSMNLPFVLWKSEDGNILYKATMPPMTMNDDIDVQVTLKPKDIELWDCEDIKFSLFTGVYHPLTCDMVDCGIDARHDNRKYDAIQVIKNAVDFFSGSITATGVYKSATTEEVTISGKLVVPENSDFEDLVIEVFSTLTGLPVPDASITIPSIITDAVTTQVAFSMLNLEIPAEDMCQLYLVIRKTSTYNQYICDGVTIPVPPPTYTPEKMTYTACQNEEITLGDAAITGYTYSWTPATYITSATNTTPITVKFSPPVSGNQVLNLTINRGGCIVGTTATVTVKKTPSIIAHTDELCVGTIIHHEDFVTFDVGSTVHFYAANDCSGVPLAATNDVLTAGTYTYYAQAEFDECFSECKEIVITVLPATAITVQPSGATAEVCTGTASFPTTLFVTATGDGLSYQWYRSTTATSTGGTLLTGATSASHTPSTTDLTVGTPYYYYVVVTGTCGTATSTISGAHTVTDKIIPAFDFPNNITYCFGATPHTLPPTSTNGIAGTWDKSPIDMTVGGPTPYTFTPNPGECAESKTINVTVLTRATAADIHVADEEVCYAEPVTLEAKSVKGGFTPTFRWYGSQTSNTILHTGPNFPAGTITANTSFYVSGSDALHCENAAGDRREVKITVKMCKLINCGDVLSIKVAEEDYYRAKKYTHTGTDWDAIIISVVDHIEYIVNGELLPTPTLDGFEFPLGLSTVKIKAYFMAITDACEFNVFVERVCPPTISDDEGNEYKVTKLAGLCWTDNLKATKYAINLGEGKIPFAEPYNSTLYPNTGNYNFDTFGLLYDWHSALGATAGDKPAQGICPEFWRIPSQEEWARLDAFPAEDLKSTQFWLVPGIDKYGFDARPAGLYNGATGRYENLYGFAGWWSSSELGVMSSTAHYFSFNYYCSHLLQEVMQKGNGLSVRCVMDWED